MTQILCIDTATEICSVALSINGVCKDTIESVDERAHARVLTVQIKDLLERNDLTTKELDAIAVSEGPGSYTGMRIGVSVAKGICYAAQKPLIAIPTLQIIALGLMNKVKGPSNKAAILAMLDARRMEVYYAHYNSDLEEIQTATPLIIEPDVFNKFKVFPEVYFAGSGASKCQDVIDMPNAKFFPEVRDKAADMVSLAQSRYEQKTFVDLAYFEPAYLKPFLATKPKKGLF